MLHDLAVGHHDGRPGTDPPDPGGALHPERSLAQHYNPLVMDPALVKAHAALDRIMDSLLGLSAGATEKERQTRLMELYAARV